MRERTAPPPVNPPARRGALWWLGHETLGPAFTLFTRRLMERAAELSVDALFFVARDGYLLERIFDVLAARTVLPLPAHRRYVYLSRLSTSLPAVSRLGVRELRLGLNAAGAMPLRKVLQAFGLDDAEVIELCAREGIELDRIFERPILSQRNVIRWLDCEPLQRMVADRAAGARARLRDYLAGEGFFDGGHAALVDIGWSGTIQNALARAFRREPGWPDLRGFYLGLESDAWQMEDPRIAGPKEGLLADHRDQRWLRQRAIFYFREIFEQAARAPHGTTLSYREEHGRVVPVLKERGSDREAERAGVAPLAELQEGIVTRAAEEAMGNAPVLSRAEVERRLERFVFEPSRDEVRALASLIHTDDWGVVSHRPLYDRGSPRLLLRPRAFLERYHKTYWRPGLMRATGGPLLARLYHTVEKVRRW